MDYCPLKEHIQTIVLIKSLFPPPSVQIVAANGERRSSASRSSANNSQNSNNCRALIVGRDDDEDEEDPPNGGGFGAVSPKYDMDKPITTDTESWDLVPPDGGWGWLVLAGSMLVNILIPGTIKSFGVLFVEFVEAFETTPAQVRNGKRNIIKRQ